MWISKKRFKALEKRIADLEGQVQGQQENSFSVNSPNISGRVSCFGSKVQ